MRTSTVEGYPPEPVRPTQCRRPVRLRGLQADRVTGELIQVADIDTRCKSWRCEGCGRRLRGLHIDLVRRGVEWHRSRGRFARFVTLTFPTDDGAQLEEADDVASCSALVSRFVQEVRRTHSPRLEYYAAKEATKRGRLHVHLVTTGPYLRKCRHKDGGCVGPRGCRRLAWLYDQGQLPRATHRPRPCIQAIAHRLGFGWVDVRKIRGAGEAAAYVAKYLGKQVGREWPRYSRRSSYSLGPYRCDEHPENRVGRRCCPDASRRTFYSPTTIGRLSRIEADLAYAAGIGKGVITDEPRPDVDIWQFDPVPRAPPPPDSRPLIERTEAEAVRVLTWRWEQTIRAAGFDPDNPKHQAPIRAWSAGDSPEAAWETVPPSWRPPGA